MIAGHAAPALLLRALAPSSTINLAILFLASQMIDIIMAILILTGHEEFITEASGKGKGTISHSLLGVVLGTIITSLLQKLTAKSSFVDVVLIFLASLSHWILDVTVHSKIMPTLPFLYEKSNYVGFRKLLLLSFLTSRSIWPRK
jgi:membrane-bound metal-dependent hydrolase YbcI (DUF457 family)